MRQTLTWLKTTASRWAPSFRPEIWILGTAALATRLWGLGTPNTTVFDEVYFKAFASHYLDHQYYFDIHPPLAKLIFAGWAKLMHLSAGTLTSTAATSLRILPALAGAALVIITYGIMRRLGTSRPLATLAASLILLDNALVVESRFILMDTMLLAAAFGAVWAYLGYRREPLRRRGWLALVTCASLIGLAISIKWTALASLALIWLTFVWDHRQFRRWGWPQIVQGLLLVAIPVIIYLGTFWLHFQLLTRSGPGDAFMTPKFQASLSGSNYYQTGVRPSYWSQLIELNYEMYHASATLTATHSYGSPWYSWPLELRPVYYWQGVAASDGHQGNIYLLGNPVIWWGLGITVILALIKLRADWAAALRPVRFGLLLAAIAYLMNYLPFVGVTRVMFLYHYLFSFIWSIIFVTLLIGGRVGWNTTGDQFAFPDNSSRWLYISIISLACAGFIIFAPLAYGWTLSPAQLNWHFWLPSWR